MTNQAVNINEKFSIFGKGYRNKEGKAVLATKPLQTQDLKWVHDYIKSERARWATETLRSMVDYATKDGYMSFVVANSLVINHGYKFV